MLSDFLGTFWFWILTFINPSQSTTQRNIFDPAMEILCSSHANLSVTISGSFFLFANMYRFDQVFSVLFCRKRLIPKSNNQNRKECIIFCTKVMPSHRQLSDVRLYHIYLCILFIISKSVSGIVGSQIWVCGTNMNWTSQMAWW